MEHHAVSNKPIIKARGVLKHEDSMLLCYNKQQDFYFLPGGALETHENLSYCLQRELQEECQLKVSVGNFLGCLECHWEEDDSCHQELSFIFQMYAHKKAITASVVSLEQHISFALLPLASISAGQYRILPTNVVQFFNVSTAARYVFENQLPEQSEPTTPKDS